MHSYFSASLNINDKQIQNKRQKYSNRKKIHPIAWTDVSNSDNNRHMPATSAQESCPQSDAKTHLSHKTIQFN